MKVSSEARGLRLVLLSAVIATAAVSVSACAGTGASALCEAAGRRLCRRHVRAPVDPGGAGCATVVRNARRRLSRGRPRLRLREGWTMKRAERDSS